MKRIWEHWPLAVLLLVFVILLGQAIFFPESCYVMKRSWDNCKTIEVAIGSDDSFTHEGVEFEVSVVKGSSPRLDLSILAAQVFITVYVDPLLGEANKVGHTIVTNFSGHSAQVLAVNETSATIQIGWD